MYLSPSADKKIREGLKKTMSDGDSVETNPDVAEILLNKSINQGDLGQLEITGSRNGTRGKELRFKKQNQEDSHEEKEEEDNSEKSEDESKQREKSNMKDPAKKRSQGKGPRDHIGGKAPPPEAKNKAKKTRRKKKGTVALREIRHAQKGVNLLLRKKPFGRLCREIAIDHKPDCRFTGTALLAGQEATEARMIELLGHANEAAIHRGRVTVDRRDIRLVNSITGLGPNGPNDRITSKSDDGTGTKSRKRKDKDKRNIDGEGARSKNNTDKNKKNETKKTK